MKDAEELGALFGMHHFLHCMGKVNKKATDSKKRDLCAWFALNSYTLNCEPSSLIILNGGVSKSLAVKAEWDLRINSLSETPSLQLLLSKF